MIETQDYIEVPEHKDKFIVFDGHAIIYRAFHAFKELTDPKGQPINALYGFTRIVLKVINDADPEFVAVTFDHRNGKSKRVASYDKYKAHRPPMPDDLKPQIEMIKEMVRALNIPIFELDGFEADDLLGTIAKQMKKKNEKLEEGKKVLTTIVTGDKDILQLVDNGYTHVFIPGNKWTRDTEYTEELVVKKMGVRADQVVDLKALMGDPSDNIPGVKGVGAKTAAKLVVEFDTLEEIYKKVDDLEKSGETKAHPVLKGAILKKMIADKEMAILSQELARILVDAPVEFKLEDCVTKDYDKHKVSELFDQYQFNSLKNMLPKDGFEESVQAALF